MAFSVAINQFDHGFTAWSRYISIKYTLAMVHGFTIPLLLTFMPGVLSTTRYMLMMMR